MISDFDNIPQLPAVFGPAKQIAYMVQDINEATLNNSDDLEAGQRNYPLAPKEACPCHCIP